MERLTERFSNGQAAVKGCGYNCKYNFEYCEKNFANCPTLDEIYEKLASYEDLEEQGLLLKLPCKVGDTVYILFDSLRKTKANGAFSDKKIFFEEDAIPKYVECKVVGISLKNKGNYIKVRYTGEFEEKYFDYETGYDSRIITDYIDTNYVFSKIGKTKFLTREEAEAALEEWGAENESGR